MHGYIQYNNVIPFRQCIQIGMTVCSGKSAKSSVLLKLICEWSLGKIKAFYFLL
jgi:hypothetical protein